MPNILIIEDSDTTRAYYRDVLETAGFSVHEAMNGIEGLEKTMNDEVDLIVVDLNMPKMDGHTFLEHLRRAPDRRDVPAIMISTLARPADRNRAYAAGANGYLVKPVDPRELAERCLMMTGQSVAPRRVQ